VSLLDLDRGAVLTCCDSTQTLCVALAESGAPEGTVVWSWEQTRGQGRGDHSWISPPEAGLWISFVLRPTVPLEEWPAFTALVAVAAAEAIELLIGGDEPVIAHEEPVSARAAGSPPKPIVQIKWPNDLYGKRGKLGGVLAQSVHGGLVFGLGIDVWQRDREFPPALIGRASSMRNEGWLDALPPGDRAGRRAVIAALADRFDERLELAYDRVRAGDRQFLRDALRARFYLRDGEVEIEDGRTIHRGTAVDVGSAGELILECGGKRVLVRSGTVLRHGRASAG
jgi:BirA family biotin operon repressor/biotin-[acetyl-CoA-carboxylase] ligase